MTIVPTVALNPEDSQWMRMLEEVGVKTMRNKCYYIVMKQNGNGNKITKLDAGIVQHTINIFIRLYKAINPNQ